MGRTREQEPDGTEIRQPKIGDMLHYWYAKAAVPGDDETQIYAVPALYLGPNDNTPALADLTAFRRARRVLVRRVNFSPTPRLGCWTWPE